MEITKKIPVTIIIEDEYPLACNELCKYFTDDKCKGYYYCHNYQYQLDCDGFRIYRSKDCITDFGVGDE
jgi:hypothetical protein